MTREELDVLLALRPALEAGCGPPCPACRGRGRVELFLSVEDPCRACGGSGGPRWRRPPTDALLLGRECERSITWTGLAGLRAWVPPYCPVAAPLDLRAAWVAAGGPAEQSLAVELSLGFALTGDAPFAWLERGALPDLDGPAALRALCDPDRWVALALEVHFIGEGLVAPALATARALASAFGPVGLDLKVGVRP